MRISVKSDFTRALIALDRAGGTRLTTALRAGYAAAARVIMAKAKQTTAFSDRTGETRRGFKVSQHRTPFNHAKLKNTALQSLFLERKPLNYGFMARAAKSTEPEQMEAVRKAVARHLQRLRNGVK